MLTVLLFQLAFSSVISVLIVLLFQLAVLTVPLFQLHGSVASSVNSVSSAGSSVISVTNADSSVISVSSVLIFTPASERPSALNPSPKMFPQFSFQNSSRLIDDRPVKEGR